MRFSLRGHSVSFHVLLAMVSLVVISTLVTACSLSGGTSNKPSPTPSPTSTVTIHEFPLPTKDYIPGAIVTGTDGALWFTEVLASGPGGKIGRITTTGVITEYPLPHSGSYVTDIARGSDSNGIVWFTGASMSGPSFIGRVASTGMITEASTLDPGAMALRLTTGPDGALWFTVIEAGTQTGKIGRITATGDVRYYPLSSHALTPRDITTGPDGALWFTEFSLSGAPGKIGRLATSGAITEYPLPSTTYSDAQSITVGPDNTLWFVETGGPKGVPDKLVRMTTTGSATEVALGAAGSPINGLTLGSDGAMWICGERIGRITPSGQITYLAIPTAGNVAGDITVGPDGKLWFTEASASRPVGPGGANAKIGRFN